MNFDVKNKTNCVFFQTGINNERYNPIHQFSLFDFSYEKLMAISPCHTQQ